MFGNLGNLGNLMTKIGEIKKNMTKMKEELAKTNLTGTDPSGNVVVEMTGDLQVKSVHINPSMMVSGNSAAVEAACTAAFASVLTQFRETSAKKLSEATGGLNIPGLM